jgi:transposase-like protein
MDTASKTWKMTMMTNTNKWYTQEFKQEAVRLLLTGNKSATQLGRELGVSGVSLGNWKREVIQNGDDGDDYQQFIQGKGRPPVVRMLFHFGPVVWS